MKYRKKPVVIEARLFDGTDKSAYQIVQWIISNGGRASAHDSYYVGSVKTALCGGIHINTLEGIMNASPGDYIIKGVNGEIYPCKPDIFKKTYEAVEES